MPWLQVSSKSLVNFVQRVHDYKEQTNHINSLFKFISANTLSWKMKQYGLFHYQGEIFIRYSFWKNEHITMKLEDIEDIMNNDFNIDISSLQEEYFVEDLLYGAVNKWYYIISHIEWIYSFTDRNWKVVAFEYDDAVEEFINKRDL